MNRPHLRLLSLACIALLLNCDLLDTAKDLIPKRSPEVDAIRGAFSTSVPLAYAASLALAAVAGQPAPNVHVYTAPDSFEGVGLVAIDVSSAYPMPVGSDTSGTILVTGLWSSIDDAIFAVAFTHLDLSAGTLAISNISAFPAMHDSATGEVLIAYATEDINAGSDTFTTITMTPTEITTQFNRITNAPNIDSSVSVSQDAWIVTVDTKGTRANSGDDVYTVTGASQALGVSTDDASVVQAVVIACPVQASCRRNPTAGYALIRNVKVSSGTGRSDTRLGSALLSFHATCDGKADITVATGVYIMSTGSDVSMNLDR